MGDKITSLLVRKGKRNYKYNMINFFFGPFIDYNSLQVLTLFLLKPNK